MSFCFRTAVYKMMKQIHTHCPLYVSSGAFIGRVNQRDPRPFLSLAEDFLCDGFEFMFYEAWYEKIDDILALFAEKSLSFPVLHVEKSIGEIVGAGEGGYAERALARFEKNCMTAQKIGAKKLVFHLWNGLPSDHSIDRHIELCGEFLSLAESYGLHLTVENVVCAVGSPLAYLSCLYEKYPALSFTFDTKMASFHRETETVFSSEYAHLWQAISHLHINDHSGAYRDFSSLRTLHIGEGAIDFDRFFEGLASVGYHGSMTLECTSMCADGTLTPEKTVGSLARTRALISRYL